MNKPFYLVAGLGKTGHSIASFLQRRQQPFIAFDTRVASPELPAFKSKFPHIDVYLQALPEAIYDQLTAIIVSPGVPLETSLLQKIAKKKILIWGDIECFAQHVKKPVIAITGTNGKSTVTTLVGEMGKASGLKVAVAGNIGVPVLDLLDDGNDYDLWVLELSSFQLDLTHSLRAIAATILNISPDHLDRHKHFEQYINAKQRIYRHAQFLLWYRGDQFTFPRSPVEESCVITSYGMDKPKKGEWGLVQKENRFFIAHGDQIIIDVANLRIKGEHNWQNALAACALATAAGIAAQPLTATLEEFAGLPHRCQWVRTLDGVDWINDSKGTNVGATASAITGLAGSLAGKIVLIAGGLGKGADFSFLQQSVSQYVRHLVLIGEDAATIQRDLAKAAPATQASSLQEAIYFAREYAQSGDVVLLSPACASFDMFRDFNHRGELFMDLVGKL